MSNHSGITFGIGGLLGHDANAALLVDGRLIASSQEERHTRLKHDGGFPQRAIAEALAMANLAPHDVTDVVFAEKPLQSHLFNLSARHCTPRSPPKPNAPPSNYSAPVILPMRAAPSGSLGGLAAPCPSRATRSFVSST